jgi:ABC-2 type transport system permease protein
VKSLRRLLAIMTKELRQLSRDRLTFGMIVGIPMLQLMLFGYAINTDVRHLAAGVADQANSVASRRAVADMAATQVVDIRYRVSTADELEVLLRNGHISVGIVLPADFDRRLRSGPHPAGQLLIDGTDPTIVSVTRALTAMPLSASAYRTGGADPGLLETRPFYNPERRSAINIVPGLIGVILTMTMVLFTAVAVVRERERGNLELLITTPVRTLELMVGKVLPYIGIGLVQVTLILVLGDVLFAVPMRGALPQLYLAALTFIAANLGLGLLISTLAQNQFQSMQLTFFFFLPSILLSGFMFPFDGMPRAAQWIAETLPLTHFLRLVRGVMLRGASLGDLLPEVFALLAFFVVMMTVAVLRFRKRLD